MSWLDETPEIIGMMACVQDATVARSIIGRRPNYIGGCLELAYLHGSVVAKPHPNNCGVDWTEPAPDPMPEPAGPVEWDLELYLLTEGRTP